MFVRPLRISQKKVPGTINFRHKFCGRESAITSLIIDTFKFIVQLLHPLWGVAALFCGVANLSMSFELNGAPLSDSRRPRIDPTRCSSVCHLCLICRSIYAMPNEIKIMKIK